MSLDNFKNFVKENPKLANFVRNGDMTSTNDEFYTNLSLVSIKKKEEKSSI